MLFWQLKFLYSFCSSADIIRDWKTGDSLCYAFIGEHFSFLFLVHIFHVFMPLCYVIREVFN